MKRILILAGIVWMSAAYAYQPAPGSTVPYLTADYLLQQPLGTRTLGMAGATVGRSDDLSALRYNPAGLGRQGYFEYGLDFHTSEADTLNGSFLFGAPLPYGSLGFRYTNYYVRDNHVTESGIPSHPDKNNMAHYAGLGYGAPLFRHYLYGGMNINYFASHFQEDGDYDISGERGVFIDLGLIGDYDLSDLRGIFTFFPRVSGGLAVRNLHPVFKFNKELYDAYQNEVVLGASIYYSHRAMFNLDIAMPTGSATEFRYGMEVWPLYFLALRGGVVLTGEPHTYRATTFGFGVGDSINCSKMSLEYAGEIRMPDGFDIKGEIYHSFAIHQSFERLRRGSSCLAHDRVVIAMPDRYTSRYRFMREYPVGEIITDAIETIASGDLQVDSDEYTEEEETEVVTLTEEEIADQEGETEEPVEPVFKKKVVAYFPFAIEFASSDVYDNDYRRELRDPVVEYIEKSKFIKNVSALRYKLPQPQKESSESDVAYLNRLNTFHGTSLIVLGSVIVNQRTNEITVKLVYHKAGDQRISAISERTDYIDNIDELAAEIRADFALQAGTLLDLVLEADGGIL